MDKMMFQLLRETMPHNSWIKISKNKNKNKNKVYLFIGNSIENPQVQ
jgi:hypothetical protein